MHRIPFKKSDNPFLYKVYQKYVAHGARCYKRKDRNGKPIEMRLTFEEWWKIWQDSGKWAQRGRHRDQYVMARINDSGHYELGNVEIITQSQNTSRCNGWQNSERPRGKLMSRKIPGDPDKDTGPAIHSYRF